MLKDEDDALETGAAEFKTVKAGCGIRFDPDSLHEEAGFDFSDAEQLAKKNKESAKTQDRKQN